MSTQGRFFLIALAAAFILVVLLAWFTHWPFYWLWLLSLSLVTFAFYGYDKAQAKAGGWRVPEAVLHGLAVLGGFPGGWLGRAVFRHKTQKPVFLIVLVVSTVVHGVIVWLWVI